MSNEKKSSEGTSVDPELNDLLDSALEDFDEPSGTTVAPDDNRGVATLSKTSDGPPEEATDEPWSEDFVKQAARRFEKNLQNLVENGDDGELGSSLERMAKSVADAISTRSERDDDVGEGDADGAHFQAAIAQALKDLSATSEKLQNATPGISEADLAAMFGQTSLDAGAGDIFPLMQGMMQSLLSKEILYPSLKELVDKYPAWLDEKRTTLSESDLGRYEKQLDLMQKVCAELEKEREDDAEDAKKRRFDAILGLMQEMQSCGQPPEELVGEQPPLFQFDGEGAPILSALPPGVEPPQNCSIV